MRKKSEVYLKAKRYNLQASGGFTLVEVLISLIIVVVVSTVGFFSFSGYRSSRSVQSSVDVVASAVRAARARSITQESGLEWGVRFSNSGGISQYEVFSGPSYNQGIVDRTYSLKNGVVLSWPSSGADVELVFSAIEGKLSGGKIITLASGGGLVGDLIIDSTGRVTERLEKGVVGYWHFDDGSGETASDASGFSVDAAMSDDDLVWRSGTFCRSGACLESVGDEYLYGSWDRDLSSFTIEGWVNLDSGSKGAVWTGYDGSDERISAGFLGSSGKPNLYTDIGGNTTAGDALFAGQWYHIAYVYDGARKRVYVDGVEVASDDLADVTFVIDGFDMVRAGVNDFLDGFMDEVRVYDRALSGAEILDHYNDLK